MKKYEQNLYQSINQPMKRCQSVNKSNGKLIIRIKTVIIRFFIFGHFLVKIEISDFCTTSQFIKILILKQTIQNAFQEFGQKGQAPRMKKKI